MEILVIHEKDLDDQEESVIGVADSVENAEKIINEYYGKFQGISFNNIQHSNLEYSKILEVKDFSGEPYKVEIFLEWFRLNGV